jgi:hypothetical protein
LDLFDDLEPNTIARRAEIADSLILDPCRMVQPVLDRRLLLVRFEDEFTALTNLKISEESAIFLEVGISRTTLTLGESLTGQALEKNHLLPPSIISLRLKPHQPPDRRVSGRVTEVYHR